MDIIELHSFIGIGVFVNMSLKIFKKNTKIVIIKDLENILYTFK